MGEHRREKKGEGLKDLNMRTLKSVKDNIDALKYGYMDILKYGCEILVYIGTGG